MKYANLNFEGYQTADAGNKINVNIGDFIEFIAVDNLYKHMGIPKEDIVEINFYEMNTYDSEYVILPINFRLMIDYPQWNIVNWSPKIIPVFLGVSLVTTNMTEQCKDKLKEYEPIGCRDEATYNMLTEMGIQAYIGSCITLTLEKQNLVPSKEKKIFFIDVPEKVKRYIPEEYRSRIEILHHEFFDDMSKVWDGLSCKEFTEKRLKRYEEEAKLIVTSRFHGTISALALDIPVVCVLENKHDKFEVIEKIIPVYDAREGERINWNPTSAKYEELKNNLRVVAMEHLKWKYEKYSNVVSEIPQKLLKDMMNLTEFFKTNKKKEEVEMALLFSDDAKEYISQNWASEDEREIAIWGYSKTAIDILLFLEQNYPKVHVAEVYDSFKYGNEVTISGEKYVIKEPTDENLKNDLFVFVASNSASKIAENVFKEMGKEDVFLCRLNFITDI